MERTAPFEGWATDAKSGNSPADKPKKGALLRIVAEHPNIVATKSQISEFPGMVPLARLERALLAELHFECSASTNSTTGALWLRQLTISEIDALLAKRLCSGNGFFPVKMQVSENQ